MASGEKTIKIKWEPEAERALIDIWADVLTEKDGKMVSRKTKEKGGYSQFESGTKEDGLEDLEGKQEKSMMETLLTGNLQ